MNENGFTGLDVERVEQDIRKFDELASDFAFHVDQSFANLYVFLNKHWASKVAAEFTRENVEEINDLITNITTAVQHIVHGAIDAAKELARANGTTINLDDLYGANIEAGGVYHYSHLEPCLEELNGAIGMDVEGVKNALSIFRTSILNCMDEIDSIPDGIAFYDPNGDLVGQYNRGIKSFKKNIMDLAGKTTQKLNVFIATEADNILLAKEHSTNTFNA